jgi:hypothetical protein
MLHRLHKLAEIRANLLRGKRAQVGADELQRERMVSEIAQERFEPFAREPGIAERRAVALQDAVE